MIVFGSASDKDTYLTLVDSVKKAGLSYEFKVLSAHKTPRELRQAVADTNASIFIAGTEAAQEFVGYLEGAIEAGQRSARNALVKLGALVPREKYFETVTKPQPSKQNPYVEMDISWEEKNLVPSVGQFLIFGAVAFAGAAIAIGVTWFNKNKK